MRLLLDTDAFCKLGIANLLDPAAGVLGVTRSDCVVLPALPHMLRRGRLRTVYGPESCDDLKSVADTLRLLGSGDGEWLEKLALVEEIDPGEALLFAAAADSDACVLTGDKRAMTAVGRVAGLAASLSRKIVSVTGILIALCDDLGENVVADAVEPLREGDVMLRMCFTGESSARDALDSYHRSLANQVSPLVLWDPESP